MKLLEAWPDRVIMSPLPLPQWSTNELMLLEHGFSLATATPKGFGALGDHVTAVEETRAGGVLLEGTLVTARSGGWRGTGWRRKASVPALADITPRLEALRDHVAAQPLSAALTLLIDALARKEAGVRDAERALDDVRDLANTHGQQTSNAPKLFAEIAEFLATRKETAASPRTPGTTPGRPSDVSARPADSNRRRMLAEVRRVWIDGYLELSLHSALRIEPRLGEKPDAVSRPWDVIVERPEQAPRPLPPRPGDGSHLR